MSEANADEIVEVESPVAFETTLQRVVSAIEGAGLMIFARVDHAANARAVGMTMPPATVLIYGHAKGGTPVMLGAPLAALDLPLRVLVREREDGRAAIAFHPVGPMLRRAGASEELASRLAPAQKLLVTAVTPQV
jgi:uncharacterized protein (DUF302 family)